MVEICNAQKLLTNGKTNFILSKLEHDHIEDVICFHKSKITIIIMETIIVYKSFNVKTW